MPQIRTKHVLWKERNGIVTALLIDSGEFLEFNAVGSSIWKELAKGETTESIINTLASTYAAPREQLAIDTHAFIVKMIAAGLLEE